MSKDKKEKKHKSAILEYSGEYYKIKPAKKTDNGLTEYSNSAVIFASYVSIYKRMYAKHSTTTFVREYREHRLVPPVYRYCYINPIFNAMRICMDFISKGITDSTLIQNAESKSDAQYIRMIQNPNKPAGYYKLAPDSDPLKGFSKQVSNYIIDNASAIQRIISAPVLSYELIEKTMAIKADKALIYYSGLRGNSVEYIFHKGLDISIIDKLDFRACMLGDIEYILNNKPRVPVFFYNEDDLFGYDRFNLGVAWFDENVKTTVSSGFGTKIQVVTNPEVILDYLIGDAKNDKQKGDLKDDSGK